MANQLSGINKAQSVYVIKAGAGVTCYGFDVLNGMAVKLLAWLKAEGRAAELLLGAKRIDVARMAIPERTGTKKHFTACDRIIDAARRYAVLSGSRCNVFLCEQLIGKEGKRVEVLDAHGETRRFYVGRSAGWMPNHLEIATRRSSGGPAVTGAPFRYVSVIAD